MRAAADLLRRFDEFSVAEALVGRWTIETLDGAFVGTVVSAGSRSMAHASSKSDTTSGPNCMVADTRQKAAAACRDVAREHTNGAELVAIIDPDNRASERVAEKIGMRRVEDDHGGSIPVRTVLSMQL